MKKILYVATVDIHIEKFHLPYLKMLKEKGFEVHVATNGDEQFENCDFKHQICIERSPFGFKNLKAIKQLKKIIEKEKFDIIHCHTPMGSVVTRLAAKKARKKYNTRVIYTAHGFHFYKGAPLLNWLLFYPIEWYLSKYTDTLITINQEDYERAKKKFSKRCKDIQYIPGVGINTKKFDINLTDEEKEKLRKEIGIKKDDFILTCVARLDKNKNQGFLINVMEKLVKEKNNIHLLLVGPDELNGYYQNIVNKKNLNNNIYFLGRRDDIPNILAITDIVVSASMREGLPVNILEAFAAGKPVVVLICRGMSDLVENEKSGYIVDSKNTEDFMNAILKIASNQNSKNKTSIQNKMISNKYNADIAVEKINKIYFNSNYKGR